MRIIATEEHFFTESYLEHLRTRKGFPRREVVERTANGIVEKVLNSEHGQSISRAGNTEKLVDVGKQRLDVMAKAGIDMHVLSFSSPSVEDFDPEEGTTWSKNIDNELAGILKNNPGKYAGFATLAPQEPKAAAIELERSVKQLGFKGALVHSHVKGEYLDEKKFWPIFEVAEKLEVPIYIHPREPSPGMVKPFLAYRGLTAAIWGFGAEAGLHAMRLICSEVFDTYPNLKIILGHMGEGLPFWQWRIDNMWPRTGLNKTHRKKPSEYIRDNFYFTTSGMFSPSPLMCACQEVGADNILFAVDYPHESSDDAVRFINSAPLSATDKEKIFHGNAEKLLKL